MLSITIGYQGIVALETFFLFCQALCIMFEYCIFVANLQSLTLIMRFSGFSLFNDLLGLGEF